MMDQFAVQAYPTTYMIGSNGIDQEKFMGAITYDQMKQSMGKLN
ncbi:hypothetical protein ACLMCB_22530 [Paenibacillus sp. S29]